MSANRMLSGTTAPPAGAHSIHLAQMLGFFREGEYPNHLSEPAYGPLNGALQNLQRQGLGKSAKNRR